MDNFINQERLSALITSMLKISKEMEKIESLRDSVESYFLASVKESFISYVNDMYLSIQEISDPSADIKEILLQHVDKLPSHIISAILQIDQKVDEDWPLTLVDHEG